MEEYYDEEFYNQNENTYNQEQEYQNVNEEDYSFSNKKMTPKTKNTTYADIMSNLNIVVIDGKLKLLKKNQNTINSYFTPENNNTYPTIYNNNLPINLPSSINQIPITPNQIKNIKTIQYINSLKEKERISKIKPKNMFFNNGNNIIPNSLPPKPPNQYIPSSLPNNNQRPISSSIPQKKNEPPKSNLKNLIFK